MDPMLSRVTFGTCLSARVCLISLYRHRQVTATVWTALVEVLGGKRLEVLGSSEALETWP